jgi:nucleotide-binding universal stress UspA family protein
MRVIDMIRCLRREFTAMPGLRLTGPQVERLFTAEPSTSASALRALVSAGFLTPLPDGSYGRTDLVTGATSDSRRSERARSVPSPWRRILCLVDLDDDIGHALSTDARAALRYATTLAVTHRTRITALQVMSQPSSEPALTSLTNELTKGIVAGLFRGLIDVHVAIGSPSEQLARVANEIDADLIVIGRSSRGDGGALSRLSETLRHAPCAVLIVHPSGGAAVA